MTDWKERDYVVLDFSTINDLECYYSKRKFTRCSRDSIIEIAAVKVKKGVITEHYSTFVAIEDFDPHDYEFGLFKPNAKGITNLHLIGAPKFEHVCEKLFDFTENCTLAVATASTSPYDDLMIFKDTAMNHGYVFNNSVISINDLLFASEFRNRIGNKTLNPSEMTLPEISAALKRTKSWRDMLEEKDIYLIDEETFQYRGGPLTYALALAQLLIAIITEEEEWEEENLKKEAREGLGKWRKERTNNENSTPNSNLNSIDDKPPF